jgi:hypothetical protein
MQPCAHAVGQKIKMRNHKILRLLAILIVVPFYGCGVVPVQEGRTQLPEPTEEQLARKQRSEEQMRAEGIPVNEQLPVIQSASETQLRSESEVEKRLRCLIVVAGKASGLDEKLLQTIVRQYELKAHFSPWEEQFIYGERETAKDYAEARLRYESAWTLLWALAIVDTLPRPDSEANVPQMIRLINGRSPEEFRAAAELRSVPSILDNTDLAYRYHDAAYTAATSGESIPAGLIPSVVHERHHALNWLIRYQDKNWDDVPTDTGHE